jgi:hypothetical protein
LFFLLHALVLSLFSQYLLYFDKTYEKWSDSKRFFFLILWWYWRLNPGPTHAKITIFHMLGQLNILLISPLFTVLRGRKWNSICGYVCVYVVYTKERMGKLKSVQTNLLYVFFKISYSGALLLKNKGKIAIPVAINTDHLYSV